MTNKYGVFNQYEYGAQGESGSIMEPRTKVEFDATGGGNREKGLNFKATVGRAGKNNDATFSKFESLHTGDKFVDPKRLKLQAENEKRKGNVTEMPFKMTSPMKQSVGLGGYYGTFGGKLPHLPEAVHAPRQKGDVQDQPKGIYTNPAKKGSYGMNKCTLSERVGYKGISTEYEYHADPITAQKERRMQAIEDHKKSCVTELPFKPANPPKKGTFGVPNTTISKGRGIAGEWEYVIVPKPEDSGEAKKEDLIPFKPSYAFAAKRLNHIEYIHDPEAPKLRASHDSKMEESKRIAATGSWRPNMTYKSDMVRSVVKMNIPRTARF